MGRILDSVSAVIHNGREPSTEHRCISLLEPLVQTSENLFRRYADAIAAEARTWWPNRVAGRFIFRVPQEVAKGRSEALRLGLSECQQSRLRVGPREDRLHYWGDPSPPPWLRPGDHRCQCVPATFVKFLLTTRSRQGILDT